MAFLTQLWLPILLSAAAVWFWAFLSWALLDLHAGDYKRLPDEERFRAAVGPLDIPPGQYCVPFSKSSERNSPEAKAKWEQGPRAIVNVWSAKISMGSNMALTFGVCITSSVLAAYVGHLALPPGSGFAKVMQVMGTIGVLTHCFAFLPNMIWFQYSGRIRALAVMDGLVQGLAMGAVFAAMWPKA